MPRSLLRGSSLLLLIIFSCATTRQASYDHFNMGNSHSEKGQYDQAISEYNKAIELDPKMVGAYSHRGFT